MTTEQQNRQLREGDSAPTGPSTIIIEKHKENFLALHGTFSDKASENIDRWIEKAVAYQDLHMIKSLEMASIVIFCIRGEPAIKVRRMLDVPGTKYIHSNHFSAQPAQEKVDYKPYREHIPKSPTNPTEQLSRPAVQPMRAEPKVEEDHCLKAYLLEIYKKKIDITDAEKFLATFKIQKPKQTCSNFIDQFVIYYENYARQRWSKEQRENNEETRKAEMMQLIVNGICKEFKVYCDNTKVDLQKANLEGLEQEVKEWQRSTTTGRLFTAECSQAKLPNAMTSALELEEYFNRPPAQDNLEEDKNAITQMATASVRGTKAARGTRGASRGARNFRGKGRGANSSSAGGPRLPLIISRDITDGNLPNYRQTTDQTLMRSALGYPLCNYCGKASHKRQFCSAKIKDRTNGITRQFHPDREKNTAEEQSQKNIAAALMAAQPSFGYPAQQQQAPWPPWPGYQPSPMQNNQGQNGPPQQQQNQIEMAGQLETQTNNHTTTRQENVSATMTSMCPYPTCHVMLTDQNQAMDHIRSFHSINSTLAGPGVTP